MTKLAWHDRAGGHGKYLSADGGQSGLIGSFKVDTHWQCSEHQFGVWGYGRFELVALTQAREDARKKQERLIQIIDGLSDRIQELEGSERDE